jgi:hypothetical protein
MGTIAVQYKGQDMTLTTSQIACYPLPAPNGNYIQTLQAPNTPGTTWVEMWFSTTPGDVNDPLRKQAHYGQWDPNHMNPSYPCVKTYSYNGGPLYWSSGPGSQTVASLPVIPGVTYYVNCRYVKDTPPNVPTNMKIQWN